MSFDLQPRLGACGAAWLLVALSAAGVARADEGMWLPERFPVERFERAHGFRPDAALLERLRSATVKFTGGGSGAFVSREGLLLTAQHVVSECLGALATADFDPAESGFVATARERELACPAAEALVLVGVERVSERVRAAAAGIAAPAEALAARRRAAAAIERDCAATGLRCDVVELDSGVEHDLYRYRRLTDLRLVFVPERRLALFGGDADNFEYPRYWFDFALLRAYDDDGRPLSPESYVPLSRRGVAAGESVFVAASPGKTDRGAPLARLEWLRDGLYPTLLADLSNQRMALVAFQPTQALGAIARERDLFQVENSIKAVSGFLSGLLDDERMERLAAAEAKLRAAVATVGAVAAEPGGVGGFDPWAASEAAVASARALYPRLLAVENRLGYSSGRLAWSARALLRLAAERERPSGERLREYRDARLPALLAELESPFEVDREYEALRLGQALRAAAVQLGPIHPVTAALFADTTPEAVASAALAGTSLGDPAARRRLIDGGREAVEAADDPLIDLFRRFEPLARELRERWEMDVAALEASAVVRLDELRRAHGFGRPYPNGSWTLRLGYGVVAGYETGGRRLPELTRLGGMFERAAAHGDQPPFDLAPRLAAARARLDPELPVNFVSTVDIAIGSSGGPVVDRDGELVGVVFDGNLWLLPNRFDYDETRARTIAVDSRLVAATLAALYPAGALFEELFPQR
ncbi:MAG: S46 family peptidase [Holophagales bacterium]|nr:S46 family peptidase [Holophagales bacterium]